MKKILWCVLISLFFISCTKIADILNQESDQYFHIPESLLKLGDFKKGSYWIYKNDSLNIYDTVSIINYIKTKDSEHIDSYMVYYDNIEITLLSSYKDSIIQDIFSCTTAYGNYFRTNAIRKNAGNYIVADMKISGSSNIYSSDYTTVDYLYNLKLNGLVYDTIVCCTSSKYNCKYYYAYNNGIIKMTTIENSKILDWYLVKSNIKK